MLATPDICSDPGLLSVDDALSVALAAARPVSGMEMIPIRLGAGRVSVCDIAASLPLPPFDQSAVDGYGIRHDEMATATTKRFRQAGTTFAGASHSACPKAGEVVRLLTG